MKRLQIRDNYVKEFSRKLKWDDFYKEGNMNTQFRDFLSKKYNEVDVYIKPFGVFRACQNDSVDAFLVMFANHDCVIGSHYNGIALDFNREPNEIDNYSYTMGSTWYRHEFVNDGRRFFDGSERVLSYELVDDTINFFKQYNVEEGDLRL